MGAVRNKIMHHMSSYISSRRSELGLSMGELARRMGISKAHVWAIEHGQSDNPTLATMVSLCECLNCNFRDLIGSEFSHTS